MVERDSGEGGNGQPFGLRGEALARLIDFSIACDKIRGNQSQSDLKVSTDKQTTITSQSQPESKTDPK